MNKKLIKKDNLYTVDGWPHDYPTTGTLRHLIFNAKTNGFHKVIRRIGRRVLLNEKAFFDWVDEQNK